MSTRVLQSKVSLWQDTNGLEKYPTKEQVFSFTPVSKRLGIYNKTVTLLQSNIVKKRVEQYNKQNGTSLYVMFENVGQDTFNWTVLNNNDNVTRVKPEKQEVKEKKRAAAKVDDTLKERLFNGQEESNAQDVLTTIIDSKHPLNDLAKVLQPLVEELNIPIRIENTETLDSNGVTGSALAYYDHTTTSITISGQGLYPKGEAESTILHEILHALSYSKLAVYNADIIQDFQNLFDHAKKNSKISENHSYDTLDEFFVAIFTDSNFIKDLKAIPALDAKTYPNAFAEILDKILNFLGLSSNETAYEQAFNIASNILTEEVVANPESVVEDTPYEDQDIKSFFEQYEALEKEVESDVIDGKTTEEYLANEFTTEENAEIEAMQEEVDGLNTDIDLLYEYMAQLDGIREPGAVLSVTEFGGAVTVRFTSVEQAEQYFETKIQEIEQKILEEGDAVIVNSNTPTTVIQPHYDAYLKQKEAMLVYVTNSLKNLYNQKSKFKSNKFDAKIQEFRILQSNLESDIFDYNDPSKDKLDLIEKFFRQDVATVTALLSNPTIDNYFLAKDLLGFMQRISDPTKEGDTETDTGNVFTPYKGNKTKYPAEVLNMLETIRTELDKAQMLVKDAGEQVLIELLERHETKLNSIFDTTSAEEAREKLKEQLDDITAVDKYLWATGENLYKKNNVLDALMRLEYEIEESKMLAIQTQIKIKIAAAEAKGVAALKAMGKTYELFKNAGTYRDTLVERFSSNYADFLKAIKKSIDSKIYQAIKNGDWLAEVDLLNKKFNLLNNDVEFIDISRLHEIEDGSGMYTQYQMGTPAEAAAYKALLISKIGQIEYENILETQRNNLDAYEQDLASYIQYKVDQEQVSNRSQLSPQSEKNITIFEARTNPVKFSENFKATGTNQVAYSIGTQANSATAKLTYNTFIPRKEDLSGNSTGYFDPKYGEILSNDDVFALYSAIREGLYQVEENLRGSGIFVNAGDIPSFKQTFSDVILDKGWLGAMKQGIPTSMPEVLKILKAGITLKPIRSFLGKQLSGTNSEYGSDHNIETPSEIGFSNTGENKVDLASVVKASLEFSAVHKARALAKDKVRLYMEESTNIKDKQGNDRNREMARQKFFYNQLLLNKRGKKQYVSISEGLISLDRKLTGKPFSKSRMFYKYFTSEQKKVFTQALKQWNALKTKGFANLNEKEKEERLALENTMELMGQDYFLSTIYRAIAMKLAISLNLALNIPAQILNKTVGLVSAVNRDGRYWPKGSVYACASFLHKKPMMRHISKEWAETADILRNFVERTALVSDGSTELERSEGKLRKKLSVFYPMGLMQWAEDSNQTLSILCRATGLKIKDINGVEYPLFTGKKFNGYIMKDGVLSLDPTFDTPENRESLLNMSSDSFLDWREETKETLNELNGDYSHTGVTMIKDSVLTAPMMLYKTWLPKYISSRWKKNQRNIKTGKNETGFMMEAVTGNTTGGAGFLLGGTAALGALTAAVPAIPLTIGIGLAIGGIGLNIARTRAAKRRLVPDTDEIIVSWQKQTMFVLQTLLRTPATPINMLAGRELIKSGENALDLDESKLNEAASLAAARDVARNLQYSLTIMALHFAIQAAFGPPDEEREKKGKEGTKQRRRYLDQQERLREEHPYFNYVANTLDRLFKETNSCLDPSILATTFGSKNTLEGAFDKMAKFLIAWSQPEEKDTYKTGPRAGLSKSNIAARKAFLPATLRFFGANSWEDPFNGWRAGFESATEEEWNTETYTNRLLRVTDFKTQSQEWKAELAKQTPKATKNILNNWGYTTEKEVPVESLDKFKKLVKSETIDLIVQENRGRDKEDKVLKPKRPRFDKEQMMKPKKDTK